MIQSAIQYTKELFQNDFSGHDFDHTYRVYQLATTIALKEGANVEKVQLMALLHDVDDHKLSPSTYENKDHARDFLSQFNYPYIEEVILGISQISFMSKDSIIPDTLETKCVQDADRLDAIGAIGIARCFTFGGNKHRKLYDPAIPPTLNMSKEEYYQHESTTINHFYEKLLLLKDMMNTPTGKQMAAHRHQIMVDFLDEFYDEWDGKK